MRLPQNCDRLSWNGKPVEPEMKTLLPFSLTEYLRNPLREVVCRGGQRARIICTDRRTGVRNRFPVIALIDLYDNGWENAFEYTADGIPLAEYPYGENSTHRIFFIKE